MNKIAYVYDYILILALVVSLALGITKVFPSNFDDTIFIAVNCFAFIPVLVSTYKAIKQKKITVDLLATVALSLSILNKELYSTLFINLMLTTARLVDSYTERKTENSIKSLLDLKPLEIKVKKDNQILKLSANQVKENDIIIVNLGERIPVDGVIIKGSAAVDQSTLTGESLPVEKNTGDDVLSSTLVTSGNLEIKAVAVGADTSLERIIRLVGDSEKNKSEVTTMADRFAQWYIIIILSVSILLYLATRNLNLVLSVVLVVCADDIAVAIPLAFIGGIRAASRMGVIVKGGKYLEALAKLDVLLLDKTGTLTQGKLVVEEAKFIDQDDLTKQIIVSMANSSTHPVTKAIYKYLKKENSGQLDLDIKEVKGQGITCTYKDEHYYLGKKDFIVANSIGIDVTLHQYINKGLQSGYNITFFANSKKVLAIIFCSDQLKPNVKEVITNLLNNGVKKVVMLTGDNSNVAKEVAKNTGITEYFANLLPQDKITHIKDYLKHYKVVAMVGDGVNDAAALSLATVGISMGGIGSDVAIDSSNIILVDDNLNKIDKVIELSRFILHIAKLNFIIWAIANIIGLILVFNGTLTPAGAALYNFLTDFIPLANSIRAFRWK